MPSHNHTLYYRGGYSRSGGGSGAIFDGWSDETRKSLSTGGSQPHNNMQPYLSVYMWKRTA